MSTPKCNPFQFILSVLVAIFLLILTITGLKAMFQFIRRIISQFSRSIRCIIFTLDLDGREQIIGLKKQNKQLKDEKGKLNEKMRKMDIYMKELKSSIRRRVMPTELLNEMFDSFQLKNAFDLLAEMPNGLLARNIQKMINGIKETMKGNKLNEKDCGPKLTISENGRILKHFGPNKWNLIRAQYPIPLFNLNTINPIIVFYFEMKIINKPTDGGIPFGFCSQKFPLEN